MNKRTPLAMLAGLVTSALLVAGIGSVASAADDTVTIGFSLEPVSLDISGTAGQAIPQVLLNNVYEGLIRMEDSGKIAPALASSFVQSKDGLSWTFTLRKANFHDGTPVTTRDVLWSYNRLLDKSSNSVLDAQKQEFSSVQSVTARGANQIVISLSRRDNNLPFALTQRGGVVLKANSTNLATVANGTGPYKVKTWNRGNSITLTRNDAYWGPKARTKNVVFRYIPDATASSNAMLSGQLDVLTTVAEPRLVDAFKKNKNLRVNVGSTNCEVVLSMNNGRAPFNDVRVRQAVRHAIDKKALIKTASGGYGYEIGSFVPPTDPWYEDLTGLFPYDLKKSRDLLRKAGYPNGFNVTYDVPPIFYAVDSQEFIAASLKKVGINVTIRPVSWPEWLDRVLGRADYDMSIVCHVERNDMGVYALPNFYFRYDSAEYQSLFKRSGEAKSVTQQVQLLKRAARVLAQDSPSDWLWVIANTQVAKKNVSGFPVNSTGDAYSVANIVKG
jgi:peptide/nickel transport system substrate-binding protein